MTNFRGNTPVAYFFFHSKSFLLNPQLSAKNARKIKKAFICLNNTKRRTKMGKCELCGKEGDLLEIDHKERGHIMVCRSCWKEVQGKDQGTDEETSSKPSEEGLECPHCG